MKTARHNSSVCHVTLFHRNVSWLLLLFAALIIIPAWGASPLQERIEQMKTKRGLCVLLGKVDAVVLSQAVRESEWLFYLQPPDAKTVQSLRDRFAREGVLGRRVYVEQGSDAQIHLADNLADLVLVSENTPACPTNEILRITRPDGVAMVGQERFQKPFLAGVDDWSHPYHGPDNNPVSRDRQAVGPYLTQFLADPRYAPLPQVAVAAAGRIFKAFGHIAFKEREEPWLNTLAAFNGFNGMLLWRREIPAALMVHRSTIIATATNLYFGDDKSCKVYDALTGELKYEIAPPQETVGGTFWKWMALENGILYALIGEQEQRDPVIKAKREVHGWPWKPLSPGFNSEEHTWGFGQTLLAMDPATGKIYWAYREPQPVDSRALCLKNGKLYAFRFGDYLTSLDAFTGKVNWRHTPESSPHLFQELGSYMKRQDWRTNWRTTAYLKCNDQALYFAGPAISKLLAVSSETGKVLWSHPYDNYQLLLYDDALYGMSGQIDQDPTRKLDLMTGKVLAEIQVGRRACTRPTAGTDAIFFRAGEGSTRLDVKQGTTQLVSPMRPNCHDGVTIANGLLYWWPSTCDCNLALYGITCLSPAGNFPFNSVAQQAERLEVTSKTPSIPDTQLSPHDWPTFRANNHGSASVPVTVSKNIQVKWQTPKDEGLELTPPTVANGLVYSCGNDGLVRAWRADTGKPAWTAYTGGAIRFPPTLWNGRAYVGSGDGWVYCLTADTGKLLWRFRAAPAERKIPVYGRLLSSWPAASGVLVHLGVAYVAAGLVDMNGTHVYALDAITGQLKWQNNTSGHLDAESRSGVGVQGHMLISDHKLYLAGGNAVSPAMYDLNDGRCLNDLEVLKRKTKNNVIGAFSPRGAELYQVGSTVMVSGKPFYSHPQYPVFDPTVQNKSFFATSEGMNLAWVNNQRLQAYANLSERQLGMLWQSWGKPVVTNIAPAWDMPCKESQAIAVANNMIILANRTDVMGLAPRTGVLLWRHPLEVAPVPWGLAMDKQGRVLVTLQNGRLVCLADK
jgi:outer membrane protein assembly factor BamB